jgi:hypothetical protein
MKSLLSGELSRIDERKQQTVSLKYKRVTHHMVYNWKLGGRFEYGSEAHSLFGGNNNAHPWRTLESIPS